MADVLFMDLENVRRRRLFSLPQTVLTDKESRIRSKGNTCVLETFADLQNTLYCLWIWNSFPSITICEIYLFKVFFYAAFLKIAQDTRRFTLAGCS